MHIYVSNNEFAYMQAAGDGVGYQSSDKSEHSLAPKRLPPQARPPPNPGFWGHLNPRVPAKPESCYKDRTRIEVLMTTRGLMRP